MSLELELWAMNSARISALEAGGGGGGGSTSDLCIRVPKFDWIYLYEHADEVEQYFIEDDTYDGGWYTEFTVPDDGKPHYACFGNLFNGGITTAIIIESCGGDELDGDSIFLSEVGYDGEYYDEAPVIFDTTLQTIHQTLLLDPEREDMETKTYSIAYDSRATYNPILLKNGATYQLEYDIGFDFEDPEMASMFDELREDIAKGTHVMVMPGTYEEIPVAVRNGGNT